ncbi:MAG TPA: molybdopterin cofactor-binding domain-containing protein [Xanthobacteraceae bacterium]|jgi:nicotinate dehydrogenase subunit B|nr:molybdopterin cofactor-binding domain-containing protein [Xanthobacteraceae bacterium]
MNMIFKSSSRRDVLKGGGALIIGFSMGGAALGAPAGSGTTRGAAAGPPDPRAVDSWIAIHSDNTATIYYGKCELGQGNTTGMLQIAGEELDLAMSQLRTVRLDTNVTPDQGATSSSSSIERGGPQLRAAAAQARQVLLGRAAKKLGVQPGSLVVSNGVVSIDGETGGRSVKYSDLLGEKPFKAKVTGTAPLKPPSQFKLVGTRVPRVDIPDKAAGRYEYLQYVRLPGMMHGRVVLPRGQRGFGAGAKPLAVDDASIKNIPGARVVRKGDFVGVVAPQEWDAIRAARQLKVTWEKTPPLPGNANVHDKMRQAKTVDTVIANFGDAESAFAKAAHIAGATYRCPYQSHAPFAPNCAVADVGPDHAVIYSPTQRVYESRDFLSRALGMPKEKIRVLYRESSGTFGRSCYEDATQAAAVMSQAVGKPVRVQFMRWDELGWDNYGPAHLAEVRAGIDADGRIIAYEYDGWQHGWTITATVLDLATATPPKERASGSSSISVNKMSTGSMYSIPNRRVVSHAVPMEGYLRGAALRSPLDLSFNFVSEQTIDELARAANMDPVELRRKNIKDKRWLGVLEAAAKAADWMPRATSAASATGDVRTGRGIALGTHHVSYGAAVADVEVNVRTGNIVAKRVFAAMDCGLAVNPALVENQIMGQATQSVSRVLKEEVTFNEQGVTSLDWASYPVLRFAEHPDVVPVVVQRLEEPSTGAGEEVMGAVAGAVANAVFDAIGVRLRDYPMTPERVLAALGRTKT